MIIRLAKAKNEGKPDVLTCVRDDGSATWWPLHPFFAEHDLLHYVVETTLGFKEAFFGFIAGGRDINDFGTRDGQKDVYTREEIDTELLVSLLQVERRSGSIPNDEEFMTMLASTCQAKEWPLPSFSVQQLNGMRNTMRELEAQWRNLPAGECMELEFLV